MKKRLFFKRSQIFKNEFNTNNTRSNSGKRFRAQCLIQANQEGTFKRNVNVLFSMSFKAVKLSVHKHLPKCSRVVV